MWLAACFTVTLAPLGPPQLDIKLGYGNYSRGPNAHLELGRAVARIQANSRPGEIYRPMAQFLRCR